MSASDDFHSRLVGWSKIILPICALALLSTLFLFARNPAEQSEIPVARIEELAREQGVSAPKFSGITDDGAIIAISADTAQPDTARPDTVLIDGIVLNMQNPDGSSIDITGTRGEIDGRAQMAHLIGLAQLRTSSGFEMETNGLSAAFDTGEIKSNGFLEIRAPFGKLTAGMVTFVIAEDQTAQQMLFTDGVSLIYNPEDG